MSGKKSVQQHRLDVVRENGKIWSHVRSQWLLETPEEAVRQEYLCVLVNDYCYSLDQIGEELEVTGRGTAGARADFIIWSSEQDRLDQRTPLIVVECKSDNVSISLVDYGQGDSYARLSNAKFFVTHNNRETKYWRVLHDRMPKFFDEVDGIPDAGASERDIEELIAKLKAFREDEFADVLNRCHNIIRNRDFEDPAAAFDEIAKILFVKVWVERRLRNQNHRDNLFTAEFLDQQGRLADNPLDDLFQKTKQDFRAEQIFDADERINLKPATGREIVRELEAYNLSATSEDIKGIAFEKFLGRTFRGEIGQFFTPRTLVNFMVLMTDPKEGELICDPASGSGGFLIRAFDVIREKIFGDVDNQYQAYKREVESRDDLDESAKAELLRTRYEFLQAELDPARRGSRMWQLANHQLFGTDANRRMARTSKMNMIMHGDGHGGIHQHNGLIDVDGIFEERFDVVLTNPPFGSRVEVTDLVTEEDVFVPEDQQALYEKQYGDLYTISRRRLSSAVNKPIVSLFDLPRGGRGIKTEILFLERSLRMLKPGGRLAIVLPEGILNNSSNAFVREFCEDRAYLRAVVSIPQETFRSAEADVKVSLVFLQKFTDEEKRRYDMLLQQAAEDVEFMLHAESAELNAQFAHDEEEARKAGDSTRVKRIKSAKAKYFRDIQARVKRESRAELKRRFSYPIFLYEAESVGIKATGERDLSELYPNDEAPDSIDFTALELYQQFLRDPKPFLLSYDIQEMLTHQGESSEEPELS